MLTLGSGAHLYTEAVLMEINTIGNTMQHDYNTIFTLDRYKYVYGCLREHTRVKYFGVGPIGVYFGLVLKGLMKTWHALYQLP
jgi:hypothetical protein